MGKIGIHNCCSDDSWYVMMDSEEMKDNLGVNVDKDLKLFPVKFGSMLLFNNCIPHRRWAIHLTITWLHENSHLVT